jgi:4-amino-4-deoxy-L-arabinose transferase-like glycosyltransferase
MSRRREGFGLAVFGLALALRAGWVAYRGWSGGAALEFDDERLHWQIASNLLARGDFVSDDGRFAARMPLYPLYLALFAWAGSAGVLLARLGQALLGAFTAWLVYRWAADSLSRRASLIAGTLAAIDPFAVFFCNLLLNESLFTLIAVALSASVWRLAAAAPAAPARGALAGLALLGPAAVLTRPEALGWLILLWLVLLWWERRSRLGVASVGICAAALLAALLPWAVRNRLVLGRAVWLSTNGGVTLYDGLGPQADGSSDQTFLENLPELSAMTEVQRDHYLRRAALRGAADDPARALRLAAVKFLRTWNIVPNVPEHRGGTTAWVSAVFMLAVLSAALVGVSRGRTPLRLLLVLLLPVVFFTLVSCVFVGSVRYRVPLMPFVELAAAAGAAAYGREAGGKWGRELRDPGHGGPTSMAHKRQ